MRRKRQLFIRNGRANDLLDGFFMSAVASVLSIRLYLALTGYPQIDAGGLHIAHMLWGGLLMLAAMIITFSSLGHRSLVLASILGGIGFGAFIDELGKFVTRDNNYFNFFGPR